MEEVTYILTRSELKRIRESVIAAHQRKKNQERSELAKSALRHINEVRFPNEKKTGDLPALEHTQRGAEIPDVEYEECVDDLCGFLEDQDKGRQPSRFGVEAQKAIVDDRLKTIYLVIDDWLEFHFYMDLESLNHDFPQKGKVIHELKLTRDQDV